MKAVLLTSVCMPPLHAAMFYNRFFQGRLVRDENAPILHRGSGLGGY